MSLFFKSDETIEGRTYSEWTADWWKWFFNEHNTDFDRYKDTNVWFSWNGIGHGSIARSGFVPSGHPILIPLINFVTSALEEPELKTDEDLINRVKRDADDMQKFQSILDGVELPYERIRASPFELNIPPNNIMNIQSGSTSAAADGYWLFLKGLTPGLHQLTVQGSCSQGKISANAMYDLEIYEE